MFPVVVCQRSSSGRSGRKLSIDSDGTIDMFLPVENLEENSLQVENRGDARFIASVCASMKTRKTLELNKKTWRRNRKEKEKRSSISSEGTIVEDLVLSGGQSLSGNMQETEDFSEKNEYSAGIARTISANNTESQRKANDKNNIFADADKIETNLKEDIEVDKQGKTWRQNGKELLSNVARREERNRLLITFLEDEITALQHSR